jgi:ankyrin repeat protein
MKNNLKVFKSLIAYCEINLNLILIFVVKVGGNSKIIQYIIEGESDINETNNSGLTPLLVACRKT